MLAYARYTPDSGLLVLHNLDAVSRRQVVCPIQNLPNGVLDRVDLTPELDTYLPFDLPSQTGVKWSDDGLSIDLGPLQSVMIRMAFRDA